MPGLPSPILTSSQIIGTPWRRHTLVQLCEEAVRRHHEAAVGQDGLDDQAGDGAGRQMLLGEVQAVRDVGVDATAGRSKRIGVGQEDDVGVGRRSRIDVDAGDAHGDADAAVIAVFERDDGAPPRGVPAGPQCDIVGVRAGVPEIDPPFTGAGDQRQQILGQPDRIGMDRRQTTGARCVAYRSADRFGDGGVAVARARTPSRSPTSPAAHGRRE